MTEPERFEEILDLFAAMWGEAMQHGEVTGIASIRFIYEDDKEKANELKQSIQDRWRW